MRTLLPLLLLLSGPALAEARLTDGQVRAFVARQEQTWNSGALDRYFAAFTPDARFTDQAYVGDKPPVLYGTSTLAQARAQARRAGRDTKTREAGQLLRVEIAADGRSARIVSNEVSTVEKAGRTRRLCATRAQTLDFSGSRVRSRGQTDTFIKCPR